jgi:Spy/CpxP family protein refolding chaperone
MHTHMIKPLLFATLTALSLGAPQLQAQTAAPAQSKAAPSDKEEDQFYGAMQERYRLMQEQMQKIRQTRDPDERRKLMQEHWQTVHEGVGMMGGRWGMGPRGYGMGQGMMGNGYGMGPGMMMGGGYGMGPGMMGGDGMGPGMGMGPQGLPDLTPDQRTKISKIQDDTRRKHWELMGKVMEEQSRLRDLYDAPKRDADAITDTHKKISELQRKMYEDSADAHKRMEAVLTKEQKEKSWRFWRKE